MTWTDRYLAAVLRSIPERQRADVEQELRSSIEDAIEERIGGGEAREPAERAVLEGLGDPAVLAGGYSGRPTYLLGPDLFPIYRTVLTRILAISVPIAALVQLLLKVNVGTTAAVLAGFGGGLTVAVHVAFWTTLAFVFLEWGSPARQARAEIVALRARWTLERLPQPSVGRIPVGVAAGDIATVLISLATLVFLAGLSITSLGNEIPFLTPSFVWPGVPILIALLALRGIVIGMAYGAGRWTTWLTVYRALLEAAFGIYVATLALMGSILNPGFGAAIGAADLASGDGAVMKIVAISAVLISGWEVIRVINRWRATRDAIAKVGVSVPA